MGSASDNNQLFIEIFLNTYFRRKGWKICCFVYMIDWYGNVGKSWEMSRSIKCTNKENTLRGIGRKRKLVGNVFFCSVLL